MRNPNGYGSIVCLDKTGKKRRKPWAVRITVGWDENGLQKTKYLGYYVNQKEAQLALAQYHLNGLDLEINTVTFKDIFKLWYDRQKNVLTEKNLASYEVCFNHLSTLHKKKFKDIKTAHLQNTLDALNFKYATLSKTKSLMNQMYKVALENDLAIKNYAEFVKVNAVQEEVGEAFSKNEITHLWSLCSKKELVDDILILIYMGSRISETLNIKMEHVHLEEKYIEVHGTKTQAANRVVPIHEDIIPLIEQRLNQKWLFENNGNKFTYRNFLYKYEKLMTDLEFNHKIHDTRKSFISYMFESGVPMETIKFIVGHAQQGVTASVYLKLKENIALFIREVNRMKLK